MHTRPLTKVASAGIVASNRIGGEVRILLSPKTVDATDGFMGSITIDPDDYVGEQYHPYSDKYFYVVRGTVRFRIDGSEIELSPDEAIMVRRGQRHKVENVGTEQVFMVFHICPLAPRPELGHVDTEVPRNLNSPLPTVGSHR
jgi:putative monooxygenase